jgi:OsmC subfamily peroxiredoxin
MPRQIDRALARRFLAIRHLLAPPRALPATPDSVLAVVDRLGSLQFDPLEVAGRNHDLVLAARISGYRRELTDELLYGRRVLFEAYNKSLNLLPVRELPYYRVTWDTLGSGRSRHLLAEQSELADRLLQAIGREGPKSSTDFERTAAIDWWWGPTSAVRAVLEALSVSGRLSLARRDGNRRYYDLTERLFPADLLSVRVPEREQRRHQLLSRHRAHGLLGSGGSGELWLGIGTPELRNSLRTELLDRGELIAVTVEGLRGERFVLADELPLLAQAERELSAEAGGAAPRPGHGAAGCSFVAPLDPLMWDRRLIEPLYSFDYRWEVYIPAERRRWGYYVLPILFGDRFVGRIEPRIDRRAGAVRVLGLAWEAGFEPMEAPGFVPAFAAALADYLHFAGADHFVPPASRVHRPLVTAISRAVPLRRGNSPGVVRTRSSRAARAETRSERSRGDGATLGRSANRSTGRTPAPHNHGDVKIRSIEPNPHGVIEAMAVSRLAKVKWDGDLSSGKGTASAGTSGTFASLPISWGSRTESADGRTSPEELLAAAHASCFAMAFSSELAKAGAKPETIDVSAEVAFDRVDGRWTVVSSALTVRGRVAGIDAARFAALAEQAKSNCPISRALAGNVVLSVVAELEEAVAHNR